MSFLGGQFLFTFVKDSSICYVINTNKDINYSPRLPHIYLLSLKDQTIIIKENKYVFVFRKVSCWDSQSPSQMACPLHTRALAIISPTLSQIFAQSGTQTYGIVSCVFTAVRKPWLKPEVATNIQSVFIYSTNYTQFSYQQFLL